MTEPASASASASPPDVLNQVVGLQAHHGAWAARQQRPKIVAATQSSYDAMFADDLEIPLVERLAVALHVCLLTPNAALAAHYAGRAEAAGLAAADRAAIENNAIAQVANPRLRTLLEFAQRLTRKPIDGDRAAIQALQASGISTAAIVALAQLIAYLSYQVRVAAGLAAMRDAEVAA